MRRAKAGEPHVREWNQLDGWLRKVDAFAAGGVTLTHRPSIQVALMTETPSYRFVQPNRERVILHKPPV